MIPPPLRLLRPLSIPSSDTISTSEDSFARLPSEIVLRIFSYLDAEDLLHCEEVCQRWAVLASNWHLWQVKLFETHWCTIVCPESSPCQPSPLQDLSSDTHPREIYRFLNQYIPKCSGDGGEVDTLDDGQFDDDSPTPPPSPVLTTADLNLSPPGQGRIFSMMNNIGSYVRSLLPTWNLQRHGTTSSSGSLGDNKPGFAFFGPGLDHRWTSRLFWKMVDTRTRSFEPTNVFTGHMGFGSGITLRLFAQAQRAVMDGSTMCSSVSSRKASNAGQKPQPLPSSSATAAASTSSSASGNRFKSCLSAPSSPPIRSPIQNGPPPLLHHSTDYPCQCHQYEDFTFDMSYLYSLPPHLKHVFNDQFTRLSVSRLLSHPSRMESEEDEDMARIRSPSRTPAELESFFSQLQVSAEMRDFCRKLDGLVYAIDARESVDQLAYLYYELRAVLHGFSETIAPRIPLVILYIMPKEDIRLSPGSHKQQRLVFKPELVNRDSYSGAEYTAAWHDSILLPISVLKLFELPNPWRLQKCSSNDIKTLIQSLMWLNLKYIRPTANSNPANR